MSFNPEQKETDLEIDGSGDLADVGHEANAAEALDAIEVERISTGHTVHVGSDG